MIPGVFSWLPLPRTTKRVSAVLAACATMTATSAFAQNAGYSTTFDETDSTGNPLYVNGSSLSGQNGWDTTDVDRTPTTPGYRGEYVGQSDFVGTVPGYSVPASDYYGAIGGLQHGTTAGAELPGTPTSYLYHDFDVSNATTSVAFNTDFDVLSSNSTYPGRDSFGWTFRTGTGTTGTNLFSLNFTPSTSTSTMNIGYTQYVGGVGTNPTATPAAIAYNSRYHLTISAVLLTGGVGRLNASLIDTAGKQVTLRVNSKPADDGARDIKVVPTA